MKTDTVFTIDWPNVYPKVLEGIENGHVIFRDGVAYWSKISGKNGIVQHIPLVEATIKQSESIGSVIGAIQSAQTLTLAATAISTGVILGAIVVQTAYLSHKLDKLQSQMDLVAKDVQSQNVIFFITQLSEYMGIVEATREIIQDKYLKEEAKDIATSYMAQLRVKRHELLALVDNLINFTHQASKEHQKNIVDFVNLILDVMPSTIYLESQLCDRYEKFNLANHVLQNGGDSYRVVLKSYREWCNDQVRAVTAGQENPLSALIAANEPQLKQLFKSEYNQKLLTVQECPALAAA